MKKLLGLLKDKRLVVVLFIIVLAINIFLRFYPLETKSIFGWDQVDNAWMAKTVLVDHRLPLVGMQAKQNSGFFIGPAYYYLVAFCYWLTGLDPIASVILAAVSSAFSLIVIYIFTKKLFSQKVALFASFVATFSGYIISLDRIQWPVNLIVPISIVLFYLMYRVLTGHVRFLPWLFFVLGFSFHLNFTSIFFPLIFLLVIPFLPRQRETLKYFLLGIPLFLVWMIPNVVAEIKSQSSHSHSLGTYLDNYYHGLHFRRILQLKSDAFIEFDGVLVKRINFLKYFAVPAFIVLYLVKKFNRERLILCYLVVLWIIVPWLVFSTYSGEISNYYFSLTRPVVLFVTAYLSILMFQSRKLLLRLLLIGYWVFFIYANMTEFAKIRHQGLAYHREQALQAIRTGEKVEFSQWLPKAYLYYYYTEIKKINVK